MKALSLVVSAVVLLWVNPAQAAGFLDHAPKLELKLDFPGDAPSAPRLLDPGVPLQLLAGEGGVTVQSDTQAILAIALSFIIGFGTGHFVLADPMAMTFLVLDVGLIAALLVGVVAAGFLAVTVGAAIFSLVLPLIALGIFAVRIWELVDIILKVVNRGGGGMAAIMTPTPALAGTSTGLQPVAANGFVWRF